MRKSKIENRILNYSLLLPAGLYEYVFSIYILVVIYRRVNSVEHERKRWRTVCGWVIIFCLKKTKNNDILYVRSRVTYVREEIVIHASSPARHDIGKQVSWTYEKVVSHHVTQLFLV